MNGLQIIKTLALKIRYASIVEWYNFWSIVLQHHQNIVPTVASIDETIRHITEGNRSISRFGDGEMLLTSPSKSIGLGRLSAACKAPARSAGQPRRRTSGGYPRCIQRTEPLQAQMPSVSANSLLHLRQMVGPATDPRTKIRKRISLTPLYGLYIQGTLRTLVSGTQDHLGRTRHRVHRRRNEPTWSRKRPF